MEFLTDLNNQGKATAKNAGITNERHRCIFCKSRNKTNFIWSTIK